MSLGRFLLSWAVVGVVAAAHSDDFKYAEVVTTCSHPALFNLTAQAAGHGSTQSMSVPAAYACVGTAQVAKDIDAANARVLTYQAKLELVDDAKAPPSEVAAVANQLDADVAILQNLEKAILARTPTATDEKSCVDIAKQVAGRGFQLTSDCAKICADNLQSEAVNIRGCAQLFKEAAVALRKGAPAAAAPATATRTTDPLESNNSNMRYYPGSYGMNGMNGYGMNGNGYGMNGYGNNSYGNSGYGSSGGGYGSSGGYGGGGSSYGSGSGGYGGGGSGYDSGGDYGGGGGHSYGGGGSSYSGGSSNLQPSDMSYAFSNVSTEGLKALTPCQQNPLACAMTPTVKTKSVTETAREQAEATQAAKTIALDKSTKGLDKPAATTDTTKGTSTTGSNTEVKSSDNTTGAARQ